MQSNKFAICESLERAQQHTRSSSQWWVAFAVTAERGRRVNLSARPERWRRSRRAPAESFPPWFCCQRDEENVVLSYIYGFPFQSKDGRIFLIIELTRELSLIDHWSGYSSEIKYCWLSAHSRSTKSIWVKEMASNPLPFLLGLRRWLKYSLSLHDRSVPDLHLVGDEIDVLLPNGHFGQLLLTGQLFGCLRNLPGACKKMERKRCYEADDPIKRQSTRVIRMGDMIYHLWVWQSGIFFSSICSIDWEFFSKRRFKAY